MMPERDLEIILASLKQRPQWCVGCLRLGLPEGFLFFLNRDGRIDGPACICAACQPRVLDGVAKNDPAIQEMLEENLPALAERNADVAWPCSWTGRN